MGLFSKIFSGLKKTKDNLSQKLSMIFGNGELTATVIGVEETGNRIVEFHYEGIFLEVLEQLGKMPLPPYIKEELADEPVYLACGVLAETLKTVKNSGKSAACFLIGSSFGMEESLKQQADHKRQH